MNEVRLYSCLSKGDVRADGLLKNQTFYQRLNTPPARPYSYSLFILHECSVNTRGVVGVRAERRSVPLMDTVDRPQG